MLRATASVSSELAQLQRANTADCAREFIFSTVTHVLRDYDASGYIMGISPFDCGKRWAVSVCVSALIIDQTSIEEVMSGLIKLEGVVNEYLGDSFTVTLIVVRRL